MRDDMRLVRSGPRLRPGKMGSAERVARLLFPRLSRAANNITRAAQFRQRVAHARESFIRGEEGCCAFVSESTRWVLRQEDESLAVLKSVGHFVASDGSRRTAVLSIRWAKL